MSELQQQEAAAAKKRRVPLKFIVVMFAVTVFGVGIIIEIYKHSDSRMKALLNDHRASFEACGEYFSKQSDDMLDEERARSEERKPDESSRSRLSGYASVKALEQRLSGEPIAEDIRRLGDAGVEKITLYGAEVRFYTDISSGICYISGEALARPDTYYPEGYLDKNRIDGDFYRFGSDVKK